ncbi:histidine kinase [Halolamina sp. CBA1230]|uniref:DICT sensory domain-containing protein n=1 Tax=Halolamina sp. CBA1230 TaxID=1853690 RepID=UPI0009A259E9|nr:DICT sensory domain-containing protein [Halolamina sp. CBA1230]QKY19168.1 histidine kinase [Halolamina sp. CBA1230]
MFESLLARVRKTDHRFTVYANDGAAIVDGWFANHSVDVERRPLPPGVPAPFLTVERDDEFAGVLPLATVERLLEPPIVRPERHDGLSPAYAALFEVLDETVYTSMERRELTAISREIEDRAHRVGTGTLHVGFQRLSVFRTELPEYRRLAATDLDIHVYGIEDWTPPDIPGVSYHACADDQLGRYWALAFDGGEEGAHSCGLLAREEADGYTGFWTDDSATVAAIRRQLETGCD